MTSQVRWGVLLALVAAVASVPSRADTPATTLADLRKTFCNEVSAIAHSLQDSRDDTRPKNKLVSGWASHLERWQ